tara:strand:- start:2813 stop:2977 length:165 start_codon:yes stop_codon:yes gene_type:complete
MSLNEKNFAVFINTHNRPEELNKNIASLRKSIGEKQKFTNIPYVGYYGHNGYGE